MNKYGVSLSEYWLERRTGIIQFLKFFFVLFFVCMYVCACVSSCASSASGGQKRALDPQELELHDVGSHCVSAGS